MGEVGSLVAMSFLMCSCSAVFEGGGVACAMFYMPEQEENSRLVMKATSFYLNWSALEMCLRTRFVEMGPRHVHLRLSYQAIEDWSIEVHD